MRRGFAAIALILPLVTRAATTVELSQGVEAVTGDRPAWRTTALDVAWSGAPGAGAGGSVREVSRFGKDDVEGAAFAQAPLAGFVLGVEGTASPTWEFLPRWSAGAHVDRGLGAGLIGSAGGRVLRYEGPIGATTVWLPSCGLERYWGPWRAAASAIAVGVEGEWSGGGRLALDRYYGDHGRVGVIFAAGRELESLGGGRLLRTDVVGGALTGAQPIASGWAITWDFGVQRQGDLYTRIGGRLGLRRRF